MNKEWVQLNAMWRRRLGLLGEDSIMSNICWAWHQVDSVEIEMSNTNDVNWTPNRREMIDSFNDNYETRKEPYGRSPISSFSKTFIISIKIESYLLLIGQFGFGTHTSAIQHAHQGKEVASNWIIEPVFYVNVNTHTTQYTYFNASFFIMIEPEIYCHLFLHDIDFLLLRFWYVDMSLVFVVLSLHLRKCKQNFMVFFY